MTVPSAERSLLELRLDIDERFPNSPVMDRISGDLYQLNKMPIPGEATTTWKVYSESWVVEQPSVQYMQEGVEITGLVKYYKNIHPETTIRIRVSWSPSHPPGPAEVSLLGQGKVTASYSCQKKAEHFRDLSLEVTVCKSVGKQALLPLYDTHADETRPPDLPQRTLTIEEAYREAGVHVTIRPAQTVVDDSAPGFESWSDDQLHDAMLTYFKDVASGWPKWEMWGFMTSRYVQPAVGGIMFDAALLRGLSNNGEPDRRGFAVFRNHPWFDSLDKTDSDDPDVKTKALRAQRQLLYTWVHEAGHAFNFLHSWDKNRPDALSWMNYDWRYDQRHAREAFWSNFRFRFDDEELIHLRHGDRSAVIMGGDPWSSGGHIEAPSGAEYLEAPPAAMSQVEGQPPLEITLRSKPYFEFMEPVLIEARVRNLLKRIPIQVDPRFNPELGGVIYFIRRPDGRIVEYAPILCKLTEASPVELKPGRPNTQGDDRYSQEVFLSYGQYGFYFDRPGEYQIRAVYQGLGDVLIPSNIIRIRVGHPNSRETEVKAQDFFSPEVGLFLYLYGSRSPALKDKREFLLNLADQFKDSMLGARVSIALANCLLKPFFRLGTRKGKKGPIPLVEEAKPDPHEALKITGPALDFFQKQKADWYNLAYHELVNRRAEGLEMSDRKEEAKKEFMALHDEIKDRGVNEPVLRDIMKRTERL